MKRKKIAVDIDDVLAVNVPAFIEFSNKTWGTNLTVHDFDEHWQKMWGLDDDEFRKRVDEFDRSSFRIDQEHIQDAPEVLKKLAVSYDLVITTSRRKVYEKETIDWMESRYGGIFQEIHHAGIWDDLTNGAHLATKADLCNQIGADYLIDDQPKHCLSLVGSSVQPLLFGDYPWNNLHDLPQGLVRVHNWQEVLEYFDERSD